MVLCHGLCSLCRWAFKECVCCGSIKPCAKIRACYNSQSGIHKLVGLQGFCDFLTPKSERPIFLETWFKHVALLLKCPLGTVFVQLTGLPLGSPWKSVTS